MARGPELGFMNSVVNSALTRRTKAQRRGRG